MSSPSSLALFGVIHMDRLGKVTDELRAFVDDVDAVFIEYPAESMTLSQYGRLVFRMPAYAFGALLLQLLWYSPAYILFNRDLFPTELVAVEQVATEQELPVHRVDEHPNVKVSQAGPWQVVANWLVFGAVGWYAPVSTAVTAAVALGGGLAPAYLRRREYRYPALAVALLGFVAAVGAAVVGLFSKLLLGCGVVFFFVVVWTLDHRNHVMVDRVAEQSTEHGYDDAVLITGKAHLGGMAEIAHDRGLAVPTVHVSKWLRSGTTVTDFGPVDLPTLGNGVRLSETADGIKPRSGLRPVARRIGAAVVDGVLLTVAIVVIWFVIAAIALLFSIDGGATMSGVLMVVAALVISSYYTVLEWAFGTTLGKRLLGLVVVDRTGSELSGRAALARNLFRPLSFLSGYVVGGLLVAATGRNQHLGDRIGGTVVVSTDRLAAETADPDDTLAQRQPSAAIENDMDGSTEIEQPQTSKTT